MFETVKFVKHFQCKFIWLNNQESTVRYWLRRGGEERVYSTSHWFLSKTKMLSTKRWLIAAVIRWFCQWQCHLHRTNFTEAHIFHALHRKNWVIQKKSVFETWPPRREGLLALCFRCPKNESWKIYPYF